MSQGAPAVVTLRPMTESELGDRLPALVEGYAEDLQRTGRASAATARTESERQTVDLLPNGVATPDTLFLVAEDGGEPVGWIWLSLPSAANGRDTAWIYNVEVDPERRGRGYGRAIMRAAEGELSERRVARLALNVFTDNPTAIRLYESLGFQATAQQMIKPLSSRP
jgi:ribosomal protein S18 acetylase RimI-like enzyme